MKAVLCFSALLLLANSAIARDVVIHAGTMIDGVTATPRHEVSILIHDDRITGVEAGYQQPVGAEVVDLKSATVLPGFIDCHIHIAGKLPSRTNATEDWVTHSAIDRAFDGAVFARQMLQQGFTAGRDVGGESLLQHLAREHCTVEGAIDHGVRHPIFGRIRPARQFAGDVDVTIDETRQHRRILEINDFGTGRLLVARLDCSDTLVMD